MEHRTSIHETSVPGPSGTTIKLYLAWCRRCMWTGERTTGSRSMAEDEADAHEIKYERQPGGPYR